MERQLDLPLTSAEERVAAMRVYLEPIELASRLVSALCLIAARGDSIRVGNQPAVSVQISKARPNGAARIGCSAGLSGHSMWNPIQTAPEGQSVMTKIDDANGSRNEQVRVRRGRLWYAGDMYVYYAPTHWRELTQVEKLRLKNEAEQRAINQLEQATATLGLS